MVAFWREYRQVNEVFEWSNMTFINLPNQDKNKVLKDLFYKS